MQEFGKETWKPITQEDLDFEAEVTVVPGSSRPRNLDVERRAFLAWLDLLGRAPQLAMSKEVLRQTAEMFDMRNNRMVDELNALAVKMAAYEQQKAGRTQGASPDTMGQMGQVPEAASALSGVTGGM